MVLTEQQKSELVARLRAGREKKAQEREQKKKIEPEPEPEKKTKQKRQPAKKTVEIKPDPEEYTIRTRDISDSESETEPIEPEPEPEKKKPITLKEKKKQMNKPKYMAIKFYQEPNPELYKNIMSSIQPVGELATRYTWENHPNPPVKITEQEREETARRMNEIKQKEEEQKMRDAIYKILG